VYLYLKNYIGKKVCFADFSNIICEQEILLLPSFQPVFLVSSLSGKKTLAALETAEITLPVMQMNE